MNNKEKREYINCLTLLDQNCYANEASKRNKVLRKSPIILYKYRSFDKYTREMIADNYAYLTPVIGLDDPFDCIGDFSSTPYFGMDGKRLTSRFVSYIISKETDNLDNEQKKYLKKALPKIFINGEIDEEVFIDELQKYGMDYKKIYNLYVLLINCLSSLKAYDNAQTFIEFADIASNPYETIGVCSLSEVRDNKVMWSLYGKKYEGYCVEYEVPLTKEARKTLYPVLYSRKISNNFIQRMFDTIIAETKRLNPSNGVFNLDCKIENVGAVYEQFCLKDTDWAFQKEWRIIGDAKGHFDKLKIKAIYLGFKVKKTNEIAMKRFSKQFNFELYKMNSPKGKKRISYTKIN